MRPLVQLKASAALSVLRLRRTLAWPVGQAEAVLPPKADAPAAGGDVTVEATSDGTSTSTVFTGKVLSLHKGLWETRVLIEEATGPLTRLYADKTIKSGTANRAISDLCSAAGVQCSVSGPGATLPSKVLLSNRSGLDHVMELARMSGFLVRTDAKGTLHAGLPIPSPGGAILQPGGSVIDFWEEAEPFRPGAFTFSGDGAMGAHGPGAEGWVLKEISGISSGSGNPPVHMPGLKTAMEVTAAATAAATLMKEARRRCVAILAGAPPADLGEVILVQGFPSGNGAARVFSIDLSWDAATGLVTRLGLRLIGG